MLCLMGAFGAPLFAQAGQTPAPVILMEPATPLLPQHFGTWQMSGSATTGNDASQIDAAHVTELKEDGLNRFSTAKYGHGGSAADIKALQFVDATGAAAALNLYRTGMHALPAGQKLGTESAASDGKLLFRTGNTIILATSAHPLAASELQALAITLPKISGPKGMSPLLPTLLPVKGLKPESVRYALGPTSYTASGGVLPAEILGFDKSAEAVTADYAARNGKGTLTLLLYPTPQLAGEHGRAIEAWVNAHLGGLGTVKMRREGPLVILTTGNFSANDAQQMVEGVHLRSEVTWEKPMPHEFHTEVRKTASLLLSIAIFSGLAMLAAVLLGLFLGGGRAMVRVLRGKPAASEPEFLGLGLERGPVKSLPSQNRPASS